MGVLVGEGAGGGESNSMSSPVIWSEHSLRGREAKMWKRYGTPERVRFVRAGGEHVEEAWHLQPSHDVKVNHMEAPSSTCRISGSRSYRFPRGRCPSPRQRCRASATDSEQEKITFWPDFP